MAAAGQQQSMLQLYRHILKAAKHFPSVKKHSIIKTIKDEFRENRALTDPEKVKHCRAVAERGLSDLQAYMGMQQQSGNMSITLKGATG
ncbi:hypothetical protein OEZ86_009672 [Tetradesmus obliquus]|uniref:Complex 1 LYR protein domain-containing protein n=1 Tax=Tetradesmus obliquus TaxID=3088 RepID=A0ABY8UMT8_TETOB|nr:hypothetical protein OEZ85_001116 [Tetradesmus obliquus]WIA43160.1 hypothetical protein OEZ86_009672 [Tetradesmus obliquus]